MFSMIKDGIRKKAEGFVLWQSDIQTGFTATSFNAEGQGTDPNAPMGDGAKVLGSGGTESQPSFVEDYPENEFNWLAEGWGFVFKYIKIPIIGMVDLTVQRSVGIIRVWGNLLYHALAQPVTVADLAKTGITVDTAPYTTKYAEHARVSCGNCGGCPIFVDSGLDDFDVAESIGHFCLCERAQHFMPRGVPPNVLPDLESRPTVFVLSSASTLLEHVDVTGLGIDKLAERHDSFGRPLVENGKNVRCEHLTIEDSPSVPYNYPYRWEILPGPDSLGFMPPEKNFKGEYRYGGMRCVICHSQNLHGFSPALREMVEFSSFSDLPPIVRAQLLLVTQRFNLKLRKFLKGCDKVLLTAMSANRLGLEVIQIPGNLLVVLVDSALTAIQVQRIYPECMTFVVPLVWSARSMASWRVLLALTCAYDITFQVINAHAVPRELADITALNRYNEYPLASLCTGNVWPVFAGNLVIKPAHLDVGIDIYSSFYRCCEIYGWDEVYPSLRLKPLIVSFGASSPVKFLAPNIPLTMSKHCDIRMTVITPGGTRAAPVYMARQFLAGRLRHFIWTISRIHSHAVTDSALGFWHVLTDPRLIIEKKVDVREVLALRSASIEPTRLTDTSYTVGSSVDVGVDLANTFGGVMFHCFGTYGDIVPIRALAKWLSTLVGTVTLVVHNTEREGIELVRASEGGYASDLAHLWWRATNTMVGAPEAFHISPITTGPLEHLRYSFAPPRDIIRRFQSGAGIFGSAVYSILSLFVEPHFSIGAYRRPGWVPRSSDGVTFLQKVRNTGKKKQYYTFGSSGQEFPVPPGAELLPSGNHVDYLKDASVLYCNGTAGMVQTAASCGVRVVCMNKPQLDRTYRNPYDAGIGVDPSGDPDSLLLAMASKDSRWLALWLRKNWDRPWKLLFYYGINPIAKRGFQLIMLYILFARVQANSVVTTDPLHTLAMVLSPRRMRTNLKVLAGLYLFARVADKFLEEYNVSYEKLSVGFFRLLVNMIENPIATIVAQVWGIGFGLVAGVAIKPFTEVSKLLYRAIAAMVFNRDLASSQTYLEYTLFPGGLPVIHTALVCPHYGERYEGVNLGGYEGAKVYGFSVRPGGFQSPFVFPTSLDWREVRRLPVVTGPYGVFWNCQTGLVSMLRGRVAQLGIGSGLLLVSSALASATLFVGISLAFTVVMIGSAIPNSIGLVDLSNQAIEIRVMNDAILDLVARLNAPASTWSFTLIEWWRSLTMPFADIDLTPLPSTGNILNDVMSWPILYRGAPDVAEVVDQFISDKRLAGQTTLLAATIRANLRRYSVVGTPENAEYAAEYIALGKEIMESPFFESLHDKWDDLIYLEYIKFFSKRAPQSILDSYVMKETAEVANAYNPSRPLQLPEDDSYKEKWELILRYLANNPKNAETLKVACQMVDDKFADEPSLALVMTAAITS